MTNKIYTTARGKPVDMGALRLQNEHVRAVGNMGVNSRGDRIDANGNIIDPVNQQLQRRVQKQTNVSNMPVHSSQRALQAENQAIQENQEQQDLIAATMASLIPDDIPVAEPVNVPVEVAPVTTRVVAPAEVAPVVLPEVTEEDLDNPEGPLDAPVVASAPVRTVPPAVVAPVVPEAPSGPVDTSGGLAAAIARAKTVKQELEKKPNQQDTIRKI